MSYNLQWYLQTFYKLTTHSNLRTMMKMARTVRPKANQNKPRTLLSNTAVNCLYYI